MTNLFKDPIEILDKVSCNTKSEMSDWELSFLCGLIKESKPEKIVEIGVAAGGTTTVILNCISLLKLGSQLHSIDLSEELYSDSSKKTGYLVEESKKYLNDNMNYHLYTGGLSVEFLEKIGGEIDFLILDTMHILPGEILDFLACFPLLKDGAIVVLHDISLHHMMCTTSAYATQVLLDCVVGEKKIGKDVSKPCDFPNIGAFRITSDTEKYIGNVFYSLLIFWQYLPSDQQISQYREFYLKYYKDCFLNIFDQAVCLNKKSVLDMNKTLHQSKISEFCSLYQLVEEIKDYRIFIYGCGKFAEEFRLVLDGCGLKIAGYIVTNGIDRSSLRCNANYLSEINFVEERDVILVGVNKRFHKEIEESLRSYRISHYVIPNDTVCKFLERWRMDL